jgi:hypothetical protein
MLWFFIASKGVIFFSNSTRGARGGGNALNECFGAGMAL